MELKRIDFLEKPTHDLYSVASHFTLKFQEALVRKGIDCRLIKEPNFFKTSIVDPPDLTMQFNECPVDPKGRYLCDLTGIPHAALLLDPPFRNMNYINSPKIILTCDDAAWDEILDRVDFKNHFFLPHAADKDLLYDCTEKEYEVVMLATCIDYESLHRIIQNSLHPKLNISMNLAIAKTFADSKTSFATALFDVVQKIIPKKLIPEIKMQLLLNALELYVKGKDRTELVRSIKKPTVHVFGDPFPITPWSEFLGNQGNVILHQGIPFEQALDVMRKAKILLNSSIKNKMGAHERIFLGILSGALVVTHENPYLLQYFKDEESILFYRHWELNKLNDKVVKYLHDEEKRRKIVEKGREIVLKYHTWDHRANLLLKNLPPLLERISLYKNI
jgi:hypothetical protein